MSKRRKCIIAVRIRGIIGAPQEVKDTLKILNLKRNCHAILIDNRPPYLGMLRKVQDYITWGEPSEEIIALLLKRRGRLIGNRRLTDEYANEIGYSSLDNLAKAIYNGEVEYKRLPRIKTFFRLHPPSKGFKGKIKKSYGAGGESGYRGEEINELLQRMI